MSNFVRFTGYTSRKQAMATPKNMDVGQIVARKNITRFYKAQLRIQMRRAMKLGMVFSVSDDEGTYAIRRDA